MVAVVADVAFPDNEPLNTFALIVPDDGCTDKEVLENKPSVTVEGENPSVPLLDAPHTKERQLV